MSYKALYNKYRPTTFHEVAGQRSIVKTLANAISSEKIGHAYLFCGPRGTGKTTMARLFAKALNCEEGLGHQCNTCLNCTSINEGSHPDVIEIDAASNNGVDQVRDLIEQVKYSPMKGRYKIYIIDEVHMMTQGAFNALLKTLEEPPEYIIFILATTEPYKVLPTIVSRCQRFDFEKIDESDIKEKLKWVLEKESITYDEKSLDLIVDLSDGGMRDALSILEQALAYSGTTITENDVLTLFGLTSNVQKIELIKLLKDGNVGQSLKKLEEFVAAGSDIKRLSSSLLDILKDSVIYQRTHESSLLTVIDEKEAKEIEQTISFVYANKMIDILLKAQSDYKSVSNIKSLFELTILQLCSLSDESETKATNNNVKPIFEKKENEQVKSNGNATPPDFLFEKDNSTDTKDKSVVDNATSQVQNSTKSDSLIDETKIENSQIATEGETYILDNDTLINILVLGNKEERHSLTNIWVEFEKLKAHPKLGLLATLLSDGKPFCISKDVLLIGYNFKRLKDKANIKANQKALSEMVESVLGRKVFVYGLDRNDVHDITVHFTNLSQLSKLPKKETIELKLPNQGD